MQIDFLAPPLLGLIVAKLRNDNAESLEDAEIDRIFLKTIGKRKMADLCKKYVANGFITMRDIF